MLTANMSVDEVCLTEEWTALSVGYGWLVSQQETEGSWSTPQRPESRAAVTGHVLHVLAELQGSNSRPAEKAATWLLEQALPRYQPLTWVKPLRGTLEKLEPWPVGSLCALTGLLCYSDCTNVSIPKAVRQRLAKAARAWVLQSWSNRREMTEDTGLWWLAACAKILRHIGGDLDLAEKLRGECNGHWAGDHWRKSEAVDNLGHTINALQCLAESGCENLDILGRGVRYLLDAGKKAPCGEFYWPGAGDPGPSFGPVLWTRAALWSLCDIRLAKLPLANVVTEEIDTAIRGAAYWLSKRRSDTGFWKEQGDAYPSPEVSAYALLAIYRSIQLACATDRRVELQRALEREMRSREEAVRAYALLSYVHVDKDVVVRLARDLRRQGIDVWRDEDEIRGSKNIAKAVWDAITSPNCIAVIACLSPAYVSKQETLAWGELRQALMRRQNLSPDAQDRFLFVLKLAPCEIPKERAGPVEVLADLKYLEIYRDWDKCIKEIADTILRRGQTRPDT